MIAIDNSPLINIDRPPVNTIGFAPSVVFEYDPEAQTLLLVNSGTACPAGDAIRATNYRIHDALGNTLYASPEGGDDSVVNISTLDLTQDIAVTATIVTTKGCISDGTARNINSGRTTGSLGNWTTGQFTTAVG